MAILLLTVIALAPIIGVALNVVGRTIRYRYVWRWWALALLTVSLWLAYPVCTVTAPYLIWIGSQMNGLVLSRAVTSLWPLVGAIGAFFWMPITRLIERKGGIRGSSSDEPEVLSRWAWITLAVLSCGNATVLLLAGLAWQPKELCSAVSPDGKLRAVVVVEPGFLDASLSVRIQRNWRFPIVAHAYASTDGDMLTWDRDSTAVCLWRKGKPAYAFDLRRERGYWPGDKLYHFELPTLVDADYDLVRFLVDAATAGDEEAVKRFLALKVDVNAKSSNATALVRAAAHGHRRVVRLLLDNSADPNLPSPEWEATALASAAVAGDLEIVQMLLHYQADPNAGGGHGTTPLMVAASKGHKMIVEELLASGADVGKTNESGATALSWAVEAGHTEIAQVLRQHQSKPKR